MQSVAITTDCVSSNLDQGDKVIKLTCDGSKYITEILLKVALNTIKQTILILHQTPVFSLDLLLFLLQSLLIFLLSSELLLPIPNVNEITLTLTSSFLSCYMLL
jgi:hypothetical protein